MSDTLIYRGENFVAGFDKSKWQGLIDYKAARADNAFVYLKAGGGDGGLYGDGTYFGDVGRAKAAGLKTGAYFFIGAHVDGAQQARKFFDLTGGYTDHDLPPAPDIEMSGVSSDVVRSFIAQWEQLCSRRWVGPNGAPVSMLPYTGLAMVGILYRELAAFDLWDAAYLSPSYPRPGPDVTTLGPPRTPPPWSGMPSVWQWAGEDGRTPGVAGPVDRNIARASWFERTVGASAPAQPSQETLTVEDIEQLKADVAQLKLDVAAISNEVATIPQTIGAWIGDSRRLEGLAALKLSGDDQQWIVETISGVGADGKPFAYEVKRKLSPASKAGLQQSGQVQTAQLPALNPDGTVVVVDGKPEFEDFITLTGDAATWLAGLPEV